MKIKTKEGASLLIGCVATLCVVAALVFTHVTWWIILLGAVGTFTIISLFALWVMYKYVAYKLKPIYSIVFSRNVRTHEVLDDLKDKHVENVSQELTSWADDNDKEISRLKETEKFRKQYLGNVEH